jgi:hypothetical protein
MYRKPSPTQEKEQIDKKWVIPSHSQQITKKTLFFHSLKNNANYNHTRTKYTITDYLLYLLSFSLYRLCFILVCHTMTIVYEGNKKELHLVSFLTEKYTIHIYDFPMIVSRTFVYLQSINYENLTAK